MKQLQEYEKELKLKQLYDMNKASRGSLASGPESRSENMKSNTGMMIVTNATVTNTAPIIKDRPSSPLSQFLHEKGLSDKMSTLSINSQAKPSI